MLKQEKTNIVRLQCSDSSMEARCHSWFLQLLLAWQCDLLPHATQGQQAGTSPVAAPMCLAFIFSLKMCFLDFMCSTFLSPFFSLFSLLFPPTWRLGTQRTIWVAKWRKKKKEKERKKEHRPTSLCLFLRQQVGAAEHWHSPSRTPAVPGLLSAPQGLVGGCLSVCLSVC